MPSEALCGQLQVFSAALQQAVQIIYAKEIEVRRKAIYIYIAIVNSSYSSSPSPLSLSPLNYIIAISPSLSPLAMW